MNMNLQIKDRVRDAFKPRATIESQNAWNLYGDIAWFGVLSGIVGSFLAVFAIRAGGTDTHVGLLSSLPALIAIFASIPGSRLVERERQPLKITIITGALNRLGYLGIALLPFFFAANLADAVIVCVALLTIPGAMANVAFTTMFGQAVAPEHRARVVSIRNVWIGITSTLAAFLGGKFLDLMAFPINYQILFAVAFAASMFSLYYLTRIRLPESATAQARVDDVPRGARAFIDMLRSSPRYPQFVSAAFIFYWGMAFPVPLYSIYWVRVLNVSDGWVGILNVVGSITTIVFYPLWGRLTMARGNNYVLLLAAFGLSTYPIATALSPSVEWLLPVSFLGGVFSSGFALALFNRLLEVSPERHRASHIAAYNTLINIAAFVSPLISTSLTSVLSVSFVLMIGSILRLLGAVLFWKQQARTSN